MAALWLAGLVLATGAVQDTPQGLAAERMAAGDFQAAMVAAHELESDAARFALEAEILYRARSYRAALGRAQEALDLGVRDANLAWYGAQAAIWVRDLPATERFLGVLEQAFTDFDGEQQAAWQPTMESLRAFRDDLTAELADVERVVGRAHLVVGGMLALLLVGFWFGRPRPS